MTLALRPTFSESWYRVVGLKPRLRPTAQISRQFYRGERWYVVRDPAGNQYHRLSDAAYRFVGLLDGDRTVGEAWDLVGGQLDDDAPTQPEVIQILSQLYAANLIETNVTPDAQVLLKRHKKQLQRKMQQRLMNVLFPRIPIWDPDAFLVRWMPAMRPLLSKVGAVVWLAVVISALAVVAPMGDRLAEAAKTTVNFSANPWNAIWLYVVFAVLKFIHELGHAFSTRRFGGECHEMGIMLLVLIPTPYVDASSAWGFPNKWHRIFVGAGGMIFELFVAAICAFVWAFSNPNEWISQIAYNAMLIASVSTVIFNANPLLRYDGYYMLSDFLEIPNLQYRSREYFFGLFKRHLFRVKQQQPLPPPGQRVWLFLYHCSSGIYRVFISFAIMLMVLFHLPEPLKLVGVLMFVGALATFAVVPTFKLFKYLLIEPELHRKRTRAWAWTLLIAAAILGPIGLVPWPVYVRAEGALEASQQAKVYVTEPGLIESEASIRVKDGQEVVAGQALVVLKSEQLELQLASVASQIRQRELELRKAVQDDPAQANLVRISLADFRKQQAELERRKADLTVTAPISGRLVAPDLKYLVGTFQQPSEKPLLQINATDNEMVAYVTVEQRDSQLLSVWSKLRPIPAAGAAVTALPLPFTGEVRLVGGADKVATATGMYLNPAGTSEVRNPLVTFAGGGNLMGDPSDQTGRRTIGKNFEMRVTIRADQFDFSPVPGQRAIVRVQLPSRPLAWQWTRRLMQVIQEAGGASSEQQNQR
jgi:putative peptide zinc metalloprotease protein